jgi:hypothetical protein
MAAVGCGPFRRPRPRGFAEPETVLIATSEPLPAVPSLSLTGPVGVVRRRAWPAGAAARVEPADGGIGARACAPIALLLIAAARLGLSAGPARAASVNGTP